MQIECQAPRDDRSNRAMLEVCGDPTHSSPRNFAVHLVGGKLK